MDFEAFRDSFPDYARDVKINLGTVLTTDGSPDLNEAQIAGIALSSAYSIGGKILIAAVESKFSNVLTPEIRNAAKAASAIMAMNNVYYRYVHLAHDEAISKLPAKLRMNIMSNSGVPKIDFELMSLAISALNGCGACMEAHTKELSKHELSKVAIQSSVKIAAVLNSAAKIAELSSLE